MNRWNLVLNSLIHHRRTHLGAFVGALVASAILVGALVVGDSVRLSLQDLGSARLGHVEFALRTSDKLFREALASELSRASQARCVAVLALPAVGLKPDGSARANRVQIHGVGDDFWRLSPSGTVIPSSSEESVVLNRALAAQLNVRNGDTVILRVHKPSSLSKDAPISKIEDSTTALRLKVSNILEDSDFGRFSLNASQLPPLNAFVSLSLLQKRLQVGSKANLLLAAQPAPRPSGGRTVTLESLSQALDRVWRLEDAALEIRRVAEDTFDLRTSAVFLSDRIERAVIGRHTNATSILTYFVNSLSLGDRSTPYSMVSAVADPLLRHPIRPGELVLNRWAADDLGAGVGHRVVVRYFAVGSGRALEEREAEFRVGGILEMADTFLKSGLVPDFPGLTDSDNCRDWDTGFPIQNDRIREKDERYWKEHREAPKALISLQDGQRIWNNRFGTTTAIRFTRTDQQSVEALLRSSLSRDVLGLAIEPVAEQARRASAESQDFGGLFIGFSLFLIVAALILTSLLFQFGLEQRSTELGTLFSLGFRPAEIQRLILAEGVAIAGLAGFVGIGLGILYSILMLSGLSTIWVGAVGTTELGCHVRWATLVLGWVAGVVVVVATIWFGVRRLASLTARTLLEGNGADEEVSLNSEQERVNEGPRRVPMGLALPAGLVLMSAVWGGWAAWGSGSDSAELFFGVASMALGGALGLTRWGLRALRGGRFGGHRSGAPSMGSLSLRNLSRNPRRSLAVVGLIACGSFLVLSIGVFRLDSEVRATARGSGTGGFGLFGETSLPVLHNLNTTAGREFYNLGGTLLQQTHVVGFRVRDGEDASCLNLNRAQRPRLVGVDSTVFASLKPFRFAGVQKGLDRSLGWKLLGEEAARASAGEGRVPEVPAIGDQASVHWALGKSVGDTLDFVDEWGRPFRVRIVATLANSLLQGCLILDEAVFVRLFPSEAGYRMFLADVPKDKEAAVAAELSRALQDQGAEWQPATVRLNAFNSVQNTYIGTFQVLGGLGLVLGCVGLGVIVLRNVLDRRAEFGLMGALGFSKSELVAMVCWEHGLLLVVGLVFAVGAAAMAILPGLASEGLSSLPRSWYFTLIGVGLNGAVWTWLASRAAVRSTPMAALREKVAP